MSFCDTCRKPGACCKGFVLSFRVKRENWQQEATEKVARYGIDHFIPTRIASDVLLKKNTEDECFVHFDCTRLGADGRCTDYENRPLTCMDFEPTSDPLCVEYKHTFKGIPIVIESKA